VVGRHENAAKQGQMQALFQTITAKERAKKKKEGCSKDVVVKTR